MPNPKRRHSRTRGRKRRTGWKLAPVNVSSCPKCVQPKLSHHICPHCGYYGENKIVDVTQV